MSMPPEDVDDREEEPAIPEPKALMLKGRHMRTARQLKALALRHPSGSAARIELLYAAQMHLYAASFGRLNGHGLIPVTGSK